MLIAIAIISLIKLLRMKVAADKLILVQKENYIRERSASVQESK
jgi:hypothetical protein